MNNRDSLKRSNSNTDISSSGSNSSNRSKHSSPIHSFKKKSLFVRQGIEDLFNVLTDLSHSSNNSNNNNNIENLQQSSSTPTTPTSFISSTISPITMSNHSSGNSSPMLSSRSSSQSSLMSSTSSSEPLRSLAKFYLLAQQVDFVGSEASDLIPIESLSGLLSVQWTTYFTIPLLSTTSCLDILRYISAKTNRNVKDLKLANPDGKIIEHDFILIQQRCKKFVVFEDLDIEELKKKSQIQMQQLQQQQQQQQQQCCSTSVSTSSVSTPTSISSQQQKHQQPIQSSSQKSSPNKNHLLHHLGMEDSNSTSSPSSPSSPSSAIPTISDGFSLENNSSSGHSSISSINSIVSNNSSNKDTPVNKLVVPGPPLSPSSSRRVLPPAIPPRSPSSFTNNNILLNNTELISDPTLSALSISSGNKDSFINNNSFITKDDNNNNSSSSSSPSNSRPGSTTTTPPSTQHNTTNNLIKEISPPDSPNSLRRINSTLTNNTPVQSSPLASNVGGNSNNVSVNLQPKENYCKFLDEEFENPTKPSLVLQEKCKIVDNYFKHYYQELFKYLLERNRRVEEVRDFTVKSNMDDHATAQWMKKQYDRESKLLRNKRAGMKLKEFKILTQIGKGGFGQVFLATKLDTGAVVTLKRLKKQHFEWEKLTQEKKVMLSECKWITKLLYSFQDANYCYLAMEYHCGGDFRSLLNNLGTLSEEEARFYMIEMIEAIQSLHNLDIIHRDIKPSNFVIDKFGHIKLIDFGLSKDQMEKRNTMSHEFREYRNSVVGIDLIDQQRDLLKKSNGVVAYRRPTAHSAVGSPEYMAPEVVNDMGYSASCDWWSLGCVFVEMLCGFNPFCADTPSEVFVNIINWKDILDWNLFAQELSPEAADLLKNMLTHSNIRLGTKGGIEDFKKHPFFANHIHLWEPIIKENVKPPFVPRVENDIDTSYFEDAVNTKWDIEDEANESLSKNEFGNLKIPFFTYRKSSILSIEPHDIENQL